jgi:WD40 repeat protein
MENKRIIIILLLIYILSEVNNDEKFPVLISFPQTNCFAKSKGKNILYAASPNNFTIYRLNYTRYPTFNYVTDYNYTTTHTKKVRTIGLSNGETFLATGSEDFTI